MRVEDLVEAEELAKLTERARLDAHSGAVGEEVSEGDDDDWDVEDARRAREHARFMRGLQGLRFAAGMYALRGDIAGLKAVVWGAWAIDDVHWDVDRINEAPERIAVAVEACGARLLEVPGLAERLAGSSHREVRGALARALPASAEPILRVLAGDDDPSVRAAANEKLGPLDEWGGAFPISPEGHPREVLEAARAVLDETPYVLVKDPERAVRAFAPLSDALAVACWERLLMSDFVIDEAWRPWAARLLERPGGGAALGRVLVRAAALVTESRLAEAKELAPEVRGRAVEELLAHLRQLEAEPSSERMYARMYVAEAVVMLAPERGDARALLEAILDVPLDAADEAPAAHDAAAVKLSPLLARWPLDEELRAAMWKARRAGKPGRWSRISLEGWKALGPDPVLRQKAWDDLETGEAGRHGTALAAIFGEHRDPAEDADALAVRLYERPELRWLLLHHSPALLPRARRDLEAGELDVQAAMSVLTMTPPGEQTDAMWATARTLRDAAFEGGARRARWRLVRRCEVLVRRGHGWEESDLAFVRRAADFALGEARNESLFSVIVMAVARVEGPETEELLRELEARATTPELEEEFHEAVALARDE